MKTDIQKVILIRELKKLSNKEDVSLWKRIAKELSRPTQNMRKVNLYKIQRYLRDKETALIPGKVLSVGDYDKKNVVAAYSFSSLAKKKIEQSNGKAISIEAAKKLAMTAAEK